MKKTKLPNPVILTIVMLGIIILSVVLGSAQNENSDQQTRNVAVYAALANVPAKARVKQNPFENDLEALAAGKKLFQRHCAECHGETANGGKKGPSLRADEVQQATPGTLFWIVTNGVVRRGMPVWSKLPDAQRWQIVTFLASLRESNTESKTAESIESEGNAALKPR